jgi:hypothetical protein
MLETLSGKLAKYLPPQVYATIFSGAQDVKVVSQRKKLTVFFSDITGFTEITVSLSGVSGHGFLHCICLLTQSGHRCLRREVHFGHLSDRLVAQPFYFLYSVSPNATGCHDLYD